MDLRSEDTDEDVDVDVDRDRDIDTDSDADADQYRSWRNERQKWCIRNGARKCHEKLAKACRELAKTFVKCVAVLALFVF